MKKNKIIPIIIQNIITGEILMLGYMNIYSFLISNTLKLITLFSRIKNRLWIKGENSKKYLKLIDFFFDCDKDTLLILSIPKGNTCHLNNISCFNFIYCYFNYIFKLEKNFLNIKNNKKYTTILYNSGIKRIAQKVGEEAIETILCIYNNKNNKNLISESTDLIFHLLILLKYYNIKFINIINLLINRNKN